jgi:hypothetical protein
MTLPSIISTAFYSQHTYHPLIKYCSDSLPIHSYSQINRELFHDKRYIIDLCLYNTPKTKHIQIYIWEISNNNKTKLRYEQHSLPLVPLQLHCPFLLDPYPNLTVSLSLTSLSLIYILLASLLSSYSHRLTTLLATYSNTSFTPSPVFADVQNNLGPTSGGAGKTPASLGPGEENVSEGAAVSFEGVVAVLVSMIGCASRLSRAKRLGVMVAALPVLVVELSVSLRLRTLFWAVGGRER